MEKGRFLSFLYGIVFPIGKEGMFGIKRCGFFLHENEMHSRVSFYISPPFREGLVLKLYTI